MSPAELGLLADLGSWVERELAQAADEVQAREVQRRLLPYAPVDVPGYDMAGLCIPAHLVGGDYYDWTLIDGRLQLVVSDVMGKGLTASVLTAGIRSMMRVTSSFNELGEAVRRTAVGMADDFAETSTFATLFACRIEPGSGRLEYVDAGHGLAIIVPPSGPARRLPSDGLPLGTLPDDTWGVHDEQLEPGDTLVVVSDGILDIEPDEDAVVQGATRLVRTIGETSGILAAIEDYSRSGEIQDDITAVVIRRLPA